MSMKWAWLDWETGGLHVPAEVRKGQERDMQYLLAPETLAALKAIVEPERELLFPWPWTPHTIWYRYKKILRNAGLPSGRLDSFHKIRRSVASHVQAAGHDASIMLAHSSPEVTRKSYLDPSIVGAVRPSNVLFRLGAPVEPVASISGGPS